MAQRKHFGIEPSEPAGAHPPAASTAAESESDLVTAALRAEVAGLRRLLAAAHHDCEEMALALENERETVQELICAGTCGSTAAVLAVADRRAPWAVPARERSAGHPTPAGWALAIDGGES